MDVEKSAIGQEEDASFNGLDYTEEERQLFAIVTGFMRTKVLSVALEYSLFDYLSIRPRSYDELQKYLKFPHRSLKVFLEVLLSLKLIGINEKLQYQNTGISSKYLVNGKLSYLGGSFELFNVLYDDCRGLKSILSEGKPSNSIYAYLFKPIDTIVDADVKDYVRQMHDTSGHPVMTLTEFCDFEDSKVVLDLGGGTGKLSQALVTQYHHIEAILFDLPAVCAIANKELESFWLRHRIKILSGDIFRDSFPTGVDTVVMMRITQDWSIDKVRYLFKKIYDSLSSGGKIIVYEIFRDDDLRRPDDAAFVSLLLLLNTPEGICRTLNEVFSLLREAGFQDIKCMHTIYLYNAIIGVKS